MKKILYVLCLSLVLFATENIANIGHVDKVTAITLMSNGKYALSASHDGTIRKWELKTGKLVKVVLEQDYKINDIAITSDEKKIVTLQGDIKVWNLENGKLLQTMKELHLSATNIKITPDGKYVVSQNIQTIKLWNLNSGELIHTLKSQEHITSFAITPDGTKIITTGFSKDKNLKIWDIATGEELETLGGMFSGHDAGVYDVSVSDNGNYAISVAGEKKIIIWDLKSAEEKSIIEEIGGTSVASVFSDKILTVGYNQISLFDIDSKSIIASKDSCSMSRDSKILLTPDHKSAMLICEDNTIRIYNTQTLEETHKYIQSKFYGEFSDKEKMTFLESIKDGMIKTILDENKKFIYASYKYFNSDYSGDTLLHKLATQFWDDVKNILPIMEEILKNKLIDVNEQGAANQTPIMNSIVYDYHKLFIKYGADVNSINIWGKTPLMNSTKEKLVDLLIKNGADIDYINPQDGQTALIYKSEQLDFDIVAALLKYGADSNIKDKKGKTYLDYITKEVLNSEKHSYYQYEDIADSNNEYGFKLIFENIYPNLNNDNKEKLISQIFDSKNFISKKKFVEYISRNKNYKLHFTKIMSKKYDDDYDLYRLIKNKKDFAKLLIENKLLPQYTDQIILDVLEDTIRDKRLDLAQFILDSFHYNINKKDKGYGKKSILDVATKKGKKKFIELFIKKYPSSISKMTIKRSMEIAMDQGYEAIYNILDNYLQKDNILVQKVTQQPTQNISKDEKQPIITIIAPSSQRALKVKKKYLSKNFTIKGNIIDDSKIVKATINDKDILLSTNGDFKTIVELQKGINSFIVLAKDKHGNTSKKEFKLDVAGFKDSSIVSKLNWYKKQYAVIVGIDNYKIPSIPPLNNAVNDAKKLSSIFKNLGFEVTSLYNEKATKKAILKSIKAIRKKAKKEDNFIFYFAGHGQGLTLDTKDKVGYLLPYDSDVDLTSQDVFDFDETTIALNQIRKYAKAIPSKHVAILLDSCFSGLAMKRNIPKNIKYNATYYNDILSRKSINILTAGDDQPVSDGSGHSPFTTAIIEGIEKKGLDINDQDGLATFSELAGYVKSKVEKATNREQRPQFDNLSSEDGDFIFRLK